MIPFEGIARAAAAAMPGILQRWFPAGVRAGREFKVGSVRGEKGESLSINMHTGAWADFAAGQQGGDLISLYAAIHGLSHADAAKVLAEELRIAPPPPKPSKAPKPDKPSVVMPVPDGAPEPAIRHPRHGEPSATWTYRDGAGRLLGYICRFNRGDGHKEILPRTFGTDGRWHWQHFPKPRPFYGLDRLAAHPEAPVLVVEGEKCADAATKALPDYVAVSWPGGASAVAHADWGPLKGRSVTIWPDNDEPGRKAAREIAKRLDGAVVLRTPDNKPPGWDIADAVADDGWDDAEFTEFFRAASAEPAEEMPEPDMGSMPAPEPRAWPFQCLGYDHGTYYYLPHGSRQVLPLTASGHTPSNLTGLAPLSFWEGAFGCGGSKGWPQALNSLFRAHESVGVFDPWRIRGRGAWFDDGRAILHLGNQILVDGQVIQSFNTDYIYERGARIDWRPAGPLTAAEAVKLETLCCMLNWDKPISGKLLAGWLTIAPICGALTFRPHMFLTGGTGSGKTWVTEHIVSRVLGNFAVHVQAGTTEAAVRGALKMDARPVMVDEFEGKDQKSLERVQTILDLMRGATSDTSAAIIKASPGGGISIYRIRSSFFLSAIGDSAKEEADKNRMTLLTLVPDRKPGAAERFANLCQAQAETLTQGWIDGLRARTLELIPSIRRNAETFAVAGAAVFGQRRLGDTVGAILAGLWSLHSAREIAASEALAWLEKQDWGDVQPSPGDHDGLACLARILETVVQVKTAHRVVDRSIYDLAHIVAKQSSDEFVSVELAETTLRQRGIAVIYDGTPQWLIVGNTHSALAGILAGTPWAVNWFRRLRTIPGAVAGPDTMRFSGSPQRYTLIPWPVG